MTLPEFLSVDEFSHVRCAQHRIGLEDIVYYFNEGYSPEMIAGVFPTLPLSLVYKVIGFYLENRAEVVGLCLGRTPPGTALARDRHHDLALPTLPRESLGHPLLTHHTRQLLGKIGKVPVVDDRLPARRGPLYADHGHEPPQDDQRRMASHETSEA